MVEVAITESGRSLLDFLPTKTRLTKNSPKQGVSLLISDARHTFGSKIHANLKNIQNIFLCGQNVM